MPVPMVTENHEGEKLRTIRRHPSCPIVSKQKIYQKVSRSRTSYLVNLGGTVLLPPEVRELLFENLLLPLSVC